MIDIRLVVLLKLALVAFVLIMLLPAAGGPASSEAAAAAASHDILVLAAVGLVPAFITGAITVLVLIINRRSDAKAKAAEVDAAAKAKLAEATTAAAIKAAENAERRAEKEEDRQRQAAQAAELKAAAMTTASKADEVASVLRHTTAVQAENAKVTAAKIEELNTGVKVVHAIVNSQRTEDIEAKLVLAETNLILLRELAAVKEKVGEPISDETKNRITLATAMIKELRTTLQAKKEADNKASAIVESDKAVAEAALVAGPAPVQVADERTAKAAEESAGALKKIAAMAEEKPKA